MPPAGCFRTLDQPPLPHSTEIKPTRIVCADSQSSVRPGPCWGPRTGGWSHVGEDGREGNPRASNPCPMRCSRPECAIYVDTETAWLNTTRPRPWFSVFSSHPQPPPALGSYTQLSSRDQPSPVEAVPSRCLFTSSITSWPLAQSLLPLMPGTLASFIYPPDRIVSCWVGLSC